MGYIDSMVSEMQSNDVLYQLNILELLSRLSVKTYGITHLVKHGALNRIIEYIGDLKTKPLGGLLIPGKLLYYVKKSLPVRLLIILNKFLQGTYTEFFKKKIWAFHTIHAILYGKSKNFPCK